MREYGLVDSVFIRENTSQWKPKFSPILCSVRFLFFYCIKDHYLPQQLEQDENDVVPTSGSKQAHTIDNINKGSIKTQDDMPVFDDTVVSSSSKFKETHQLKLPENSFQITSKFVNITAVTRYNLFLIDFYVIVLWVFKKCLSVLNSFLNWSFSKTLANSELVS